VAKRTQDSRTRQADQRRRVVHLVADAPLVQLPGDVARRSRLILRPRQPRELRELFQQRPRLIERDISQNRLLSRFVFPVLVHEALKLPSLTPPSNSREGDKTS